MWEVPGRGPVERRTVLRGVAGAAGTGALASLAGCGRVRDVLGGGNDGPGYAGWLHRPPVAAVVGDADRGTGFRFGHVSPPSLLENAPAVPDRWVEQIREALDFGELGIEPSDVEGMTTLTGEALTASGPLVTGVYRADYDRETFLDRFEDGWIRNEYRGYTLLVRDGSAARGWAVGDDEFVLTRVPRGIDDGTRFEAALERAVDVGNGAADGYTDRSEDGAALVSALGQGIRVKGRNSALGMGVDGVVSVGEAQFASESGLRGRYVAVFEDAGVVDPEAIEGQESVRRRYAGLSVEVDGRTVVATGEYDPPER